MRIFTGTWPPGRVESLIALSDIVISLHRAEGFGLVPAQAMLRGVPVVATAFSGNMDYMDSVSAALVDFCLVPVQDSAQIYEPMKGAVWAEPDVAHAADHLRRLGDDAAARRALGAAGRAYAERALDGAALRDALAANGV
jgi:glycosyltransferase involved in cell wall biosynthesis